jgi:hypothetical protein
MSRRIRYLEAYCASILRIAVNTFIRGSSLWPNVQLRMTVESATVLQDFYLHLRTNYRSLDATPITTRQLESMVRLAEARARSEMRELVSKQDALDVVELMCVPYLLNSRQEILVV